MDSLNHINLYHRGVSGFKNECSVLWRWFTL